MGKKRIFQKTETEILKETDKQEKAQRKAAVLPMSQKSKVVEGQAHIQATYNNTIISLTDNQGNILAWSTAGGLGFRGPKKATPFAASKVAETVVAKIKDRGLARIRVFVKGIGTGREAAIRSLANSGLEVISIKDMTPVPHNGCRPPKPRRV